MTTDTILNNLGLTALSEMQQNAVEMVRHNQNAVLLAPTGSGKTLAFLLPLVEAIDADRGEVQTLILSPTRELALQTMTVLTAYTHQSGFSSRESQYIIFFLPRM